MSKVQAEFRALFDDPHAPSAFAALQVPTVVIAGDRSPDPTRRVAERLAATIPGARLVVLTGRGHMGALEDPDAVCAQLPLPWAPPARIPTTTAPTGRDALAVA
jgi:pimeloyl-ACP methyl ester carboxylesterase